MENEIVNNTESQHFEVNLGNDLAKLEYRFYGNEFALMHTYVPPAFEGRGVASSLAHHALEYAKEHYLKVIIYCPFVSAYLKSHPEYNVLVEKNYSEFHSH